jgi:hypothetical protein
MASELSPENEQFLAQAIAVGLYPSKEAALDAAVGALREKAGDIPLVRADHMQAVEQGLASANAGRVKDWTAADVERIKRIGREQLGVKG